MARSRNIKPGIMANEYLAELDPLDRLLFVYLWMLADREGRLEDRPKRIKAEALPYDNADADQILTRLKKAGFILRYSVDGQKIIQVLNFSKHQNPHVREQGSSLPEYNPESADPEPCTEKAQPRQCQGSDEAVTSPSDSLIPDSLIPDSNKPPCANREARQPSDADLFDKFWKLYPNKKGKASALKAWKKLKLTDDLINQIFEGLTRYCSSAEWAKDGGQFIPHPATWLNGRRWEDEVRPISNVHAFPGQSRHTGFDQRDYSAGLIEREDGTHGF